MIAGLSKNGCEGEALHLFCEMHAEGTSLTPYVFSSVLSACTKGQLFETGMQLHALTIKQGFSSETFVCNALVTLYSRLGNFTSAEQVFSKLKDKDGVSYNSLISGLAQQGFSDRALELFEKMQVEGLDPDCVTVASLLSVCASTKALHRGKQLHSYALKAGMSADSIIEGALLDLYVKSSDIKTAHDFFLTTQNENVVLWNVMLVAYGQLDDLSQSFRLFKEMQVKGLVPNQFTYPSILRTCTLSGALYLGEQIHTLVMKTGFDSEIEISNALITMYAKCGSISDSKRKFLEMAEKNDVTWNAMITAYSQHGDGLQAVNHFENMKKSGSVPNHVTFIGVLTACSHVGLVNEGICYFESMKKEHGLVPKPEHYACVVDLLSRAGLLSRARKFVEEMPIKPDPMVWRTLLSSCIVHKNIELGELAAKNLLDLEPEDSASYVLLSNMYAVSRRWNYRDQTREMMKNRGVRKEPGRSWIEVMNKIHAFFVGDKLHPLADEIYEYLEELNNRAADIGYVQDHNSLLNETEMEQKDPTLYVHSEKLAVTFALLSLPDGIPIRVMKNLRVCSDCHNWIKFISRISNREIVVRDAYRFHHFENGNCSCKDFW
ncbi:unnamed protein product [Linum tenue]|uniref:DYW domain-containing protein n=1 Tax=Linum tenue TaxID=586396 RepID=A0AAV0HG90_9ROSI|nr:unnamed protein product [Linum tenue]